MFILQKLSPIDPVHACSARRPHRRRSRRGARARPRPAAPAQFGSYLAACCTATSAPRTGPAARWAPISASTSRRPRSWPVRPGVRARPGRDLGHRVDARWPGAAAFRLVLVARASTPSFLLALPGILLFYSKLGWLPATGRTSYANPPTGPTGLLTVDGLLHGQSAVTLDALRHLVLPAVAIALVPGRSDRAGAAPSCWPGCSAITSAPLALKVWQNDGGLSPCPPELPGAALAMTGRRSAWCSRA